MLNIKANYFSVTFRINCIATVKEFLVDAEQMSLRWDPKV